MSRGKKGIDLGLGVTMVAAILLLITLNFQVLMGGDDGPTKGFATYTGLPCAGSPGCPECACLYYCDTPHPFGWCTIGWPYCLLC